MEDLLLVRLSQLAPHLDRLAFLEDSSVGYDVLAGALVWSDEKPASENLSFDVNQSLRPVLHYRTTLIVGEPDLQYEKCWLQAQELAPRWPGFHPSRRSPDLCELVKSSKADMMRDLDELFDD